MTQARDFNKEQWEALTTKEGPVLVLAGAGSGKTRVVTSRIAYLIESGVPPSAILGVTFTNKAAGEMRERVQKLAQHQVLICTFHSLGVRILRESIHLLGYKNSFMIYDEEDVLKLLKTCVDELELSEEIKKKVKVLRQKISQSKNSLLGPDQASYTVEFGEDFGKIYGLYQKKLKECQAVDFDDLLLLPVTIWSHYPDALAHYQERWPFVLIDEFQDTNEAQYTLARLLVEKQRNLFVVGDPDQSIYSWRGAQIGNILHFKRDYPEVKVVRLEQNYRSCTNILEAANALISHNSDRYEKELWSHLGEGAKIQIFKGGDENSEAQFVASTIENLHDEGIPFKEMAVFYRTNAQSRSFEDYLLSRGIPYVIVGGLSFYQRKEIKDVLAFLRIAQSGADYISFLRTINLPKRGLGATTIDKMRTNASLEGMTILAYCEALIEGKTPNTSLRLSAKQKEGVASYLHLIHDLREIYQRQSSIRDLVLTAIERSGYVNVLRDDPESYEDRSENLNALVAKAVEWEKSAPEPTLEAFLEELSLKSTLDEADTGGDHLSLMTLHHGKGLEFTAAFMAGLEEGLLPHINSQKDEANIEEERRLCYVGMTRAKRYLYLSHCSMRYLWGSRRTQYPSCFLREIPRKYTENVSFAQPLFRVGSRPVMKPKEKEYSPGERIFHKDFGIGQVQQAYEGSMGLTYKILFDKDQSLRTLVAKYALLSSI